MNSKTIDHTETKRRFKREWSDSSQLFIKTPDQKLFQEVPLHFRRRSGSSVQQEQVGEGFSYSTGWVVLPQGKTSKPSPLTEPKELSSRVGGASMVQKTTLDPVLLNRLTDDVIRRVEQRVRIERERRGL